MKNVGLIGLGFVGGALNESFKLVFNMYKYDIVPEKRNIESLIDLCDKCNVIFTALPTPINNDGSINLFAIESTLEKLNNINKKNIIVIKSSLPPGKTKYLQQKYSNLKLVFNPEFLTERNAVEDFKNQTKVILGGNKDDTDIVKEIYECGLPGVTVYQTDTSTAEMVKFIVNCFLSTKVSFFNEMNQVCKKLNIDYNESINLSLLDPRIGYSHVQVPGFDGHYGFGGSCFPANINIMIDEMLKLNLKPTILQAVWDKNLEVRPEKDWELLKGRCVIENKK